MDNRSCNSLNVVGTTMEPNTNSPNNNDYYGSDDDRTDTANNDYYNYSYNK